MTRLPLQCSLFAAVVSVVLLSSFAAPALLAQTDVPAAPALAPDATVGPVFPKPDAKNFTADSPTAEQVEGFLKASWGYDSGRMYQVQSIVKSSVPGISSVTVLAGEKGQKDVQALQFFVLPDGKHFVAGPILPFGAHIYDDNRATLVKRADGPWEGAASKDLELVEFADFQCPHCKDAQPTVQKLIADYPNAHFVFQSFPLPQHPQAFRAAAYGVCVAKLGGNKAFFAYDAAVYDGQAGLATEEGATLTLNSAVSTAGQSPDAVEACSKTPETKAAVEAGVKLANDISVTQTPSLSINGRIVPLGGISYDTLKQLIDYHAANDGAAK